MPDLQLDVLTAIANFYTFNARMKIQLAEGKIKTGRDDAGTANT
ncbi:MAG: hypothetical protein WB445_11240 [Acinetobacter sp.]